MDEREIRRRHEELESMRSTQSVKVLAELRSQAHRDRGWLLKRLADVKMELASDLDGSDTGS